jgi:hypothetical protein
MQKQKHTKFRQQRKIFGFGNQINLIIAKLIYKAYRSQQKSKQYLSLTLEQGSIISSLAATRATQPSTTLLRYTNGVLPISYIGPSTKEYISQGSHIKAPQEQIQQFWKWQWSQLTSVTSLAIEPFSSAIFCSGYCTSIEHME